MNANGRNSAATRLACYTLHGAATVLSVVLAAISIVAGTARPAQAQTVPFGKNKIQYQDFEWRMLSGEHIDVYYYPEEEQVARLALSYGEESYRLLEQKFQHHPFRRIPLIVYSSDQHFEQTNILPGFIPEGVLGFTEYLKRRVALPFRGDYDQFRKTLRHELVHAFQISKIAEVNRLHPRTRRPPPQQIHWWTEGLAEFWSGEQTTEDEMFVRDIVVRGRLPTIPQFGRMYGYLGYPLGAELHKYLAGRFGEEYIVRVYEDFWKYESFEETLEGVLGIPIEQLTREWKYALEQRFFPVYASRPPLNIGAREVINRGGANYKPVIYTPANDTAAQLLFMSPRTGYTTLYRTTLARGEEDLDKIIEGERSAEFESFHAYESRFDVNQNGVLALGTRYLERDALILWDIETRNIVGRYQWPDLVGVRSPSWSPDGRKIVFEGLSTAGYSDLYLVDFETHQRRTLTSDHYRDEDPDWSPDGRTLVFASDRTPYGPYGYTNLYLLDTETDSIQPLTLGQWNDVNPRWSRTGDRIAFSSDRSGFYDIYAVDRSGRGRRLTNMAGGAFDPEWLPQDRGIVFAGFIEGSFRIYEYPLAGDTAAVPAVALGNGDNNFHKEANWQWEGITGATVAAAKREDYRPLEKLSLDFAGGDAVYAPGLGSAQGAQFLLSDMLGNHILFAGISATQADNLADFVNNFSGNLLYLNLSRRLNYGLGVYRFDGRFRDVAYDIYDETNYGAYALGSYPFSRFSRVEVQLGVEKSNRVDIEDAFEAGVIGQNPEAALRDLSREGYLATNYVSFVRDNTLWLPTGPIDGERFNITAGMISCFSCTYTSQVTGLPVKRSAATDNYVLIGDYRRYIRTTLYSAYAVRATAFLSNGTVPARSVLGGPHRLRGYPRFSMAGSRLWLLNQEWRFPIVQGIGLAFPMGNVTLPGIQGALFTDIGSSWLESQSKPEGTWGSYGLSFRTSLGPPLVLRLDVGRRFRIGGAPPVVFGNRENFNDTFVDFFFGFNY